MEEDKIKLIEEGHKYIFPELHSDWDAYVNSFNKDYQIALAKRAVGIMASLDENPSKENCLAEAKKLLEKLESVFFLMVRGMVFRYSPYGPEFCLALEKESAEWEHNRGYKPGKVKVTIDAENIGLLLDKMFDNHRILKEQEKEHNHTI